MPPLRLTIRIIIGFYRSFFIAAALITICCASLFWQYGYSIFAAIFWLKLASLAIIYWFINNYKRKEFYYYYNLGISKRVLWMATLLFDFLLFILLITQLNKFR